MLQMCPTDALIDSLSGDLMTLSKEFGHVLGVCSGTLHVAFSVCSNSVSVNACVRLLYVTTVVALGFVAQDFDGCLQHLSARQDTDLDQVPCRW